MLQISDPNGLTMSQELSQSCNQVLGIPEDLAKTI